MEWETKRGTRIGIPAGDESWFSAVENFGLDVYRFAAEDMRKLAGHDVEVFVDIGANIGTSTLALLEQFPKARCYAFEPGTRAFQQLTKNVAMNGYKAQVECRQAAVVGEFIEPEIDFYENVADSATSVAFQGGNVSAGVRRTRVPAVPFEQLVSDIGQDIDLVKMDVEGSEYDILMGTPARAWTRVRTLILEYHPGRGLSWRNLRKALSAAGLRIEAQMRCNDSDDFGFFWCANSKGLSGGIFGS